MMQIVMRRGRAGFADLIAVDDVGRDKVFNLSIDREVLVSIKCARNPKAHRLAWKLASLLSDNMDEFPSPECAMDAIKIGTGHVETYINPSNGSIVLRPKSISFADMEQGDFSDFLTRAISLISSRWLGTSNAELLAEVNAVLDGSL